MEFMMTEFENKTSVIFDNDFKPSDETMEAIKELLSVGLKMYEADEKLRKLIGDNYDHQFFGKWNHLKIFKYKDYSTEED